MERIVTAREMRDMDQRAIAMSIPGLVLMEHAALAVASRAAEMLEESGGDTIAVFCGKGNNGGDGFAAARLLSGQGCRITLFVCTNPREIQNESRIQFRAAKKLGLDIRILKKPPEQSMLNQFDLIIDALLGTGINGAVTGLIAEIIDRINRSDVPVLAVDIPSGLSGDTGQFEGACIEADSTVTFGALKRGLLFSPGRELAGIIDLADIGIPEPATASVDIRTWLIETGDAGELLPARPVSAHKGDFGKVAVLAGSTGLTGAAALCSLAALKAGSGLVMLGCPESVQGILANKLTEVMTRSLPQTPYGTLALSGEPEIRKLLEWADVLAIGPGLSQMPETMALVRKTVMESTLPVVIDADGLNAFAGHADLIKEAEAPLILTPHSGELSRLSGLTIAEIEKNRIETARQEAGEMNCVVVLKGAPTVIGCADGRVFVNSTGNSGMATAGAGDVLTGLIAGFLAQGCSTIDAAICGVFLHGLAGDLAERKDSGRSMTALSLLDQVGQAFRQIEGRS